MSKDIENLSADPLQSSAPPIDVPSVVDEAKIRFFIENGYFIVPDLIASEELEELKAETIKIARGGYPSKNLKPVELNLTDEQVLKSVLCIHQAHYISPIIRRYVMHPKVCGALAQIVAAHLPWWDGSVKCMQSMLFVKPPNFQGQAWHQDEIYIPTRDRSLCGAWIAIDAATIENGCLWILPGSHRNGYLYPQRDHGNYDEFDIAQESHGFDESAEVPVEVNAGSVVFFNGYLLHRSRRNRSNVYRRVLVNHYMNAWSLLPWHTKDDETGDSGARADFRRIFPVAGTDPYAWKGIIEDPDDVHLRACKAIDPRIE